MAEFALACVLLTLRPIIEGAAWLRAGGDGGSRLTGAVDEGFTGEELASKTVGVVGWGEIGRRLGLACLALGANVVAYDPGVPQAAITAAGADAARDLEQLLRGADVVSLHVPLTVATRELIGAAQLAWMRPGAALVNTSRGGVVDEAALADALAGGHLRAAATDVFADEPPAPNHRLLRLPGSICTPHMAGATRQALARMGALAARAVVDALAGRWPRGVVNPEAAHRQGLTRPNSAT